jgi:hypothetical protein
MHPLSQGADGVKVLIGCEESGILRDAFLARGHDAMSADLAPSNAAGPHYVGDVRDVLDYPWDLVIMHPPCTNTSHERTEISWAHSTFNPWIGCTRVSPGCDNCYAATLMDDRYGRVKWGAGEARSRTKTWDQPKRWNKLAAASGKPWRVFCASLADVFDNEVPDEWRTTCGR